MEGMCAAHSRLSYVYPTSIAIILVCPTSVAIILVCPTSVAIIHLVCFIVALYIKYSRALTFENFSHIL